MMSYVLLWVKTSILLILLVSHIENDRSVCHIPIGVNTCCSHHPANERGERGPLGRSLYTLFISLDSGTAVFKANKSYSKKKQPCLHLDIGEGESTR